MPIHVCCVVANCEGLKVNMEGSILDILESKKRFLGWGDGDIDRCVEAIERCAPGYLDMEEEGNGMVPDYDHAQFRSHQEPEKMPSADK